MIKAELNPLFTTKTTKGKSVCTLRINKHVKIYSCPPLDAAVSFEHHFLLNHCQD